MICNSPESSQLVCFSVILQSKSQAGPYSFHSLPNIRTHGVVTKQKKKAKRNRKGAKMKFTVALLSLCVSLASAGVVIVPIKPDQVVPKKSGDCFSGVITPQGCG